MTVANPKTLLLGFVNTHNSYLTSKTMPLGLKVISSAAKRAGWQVEGKYWGTEITVDRFVEDLLRIRPEILGLYTDMMNIFTIARLLNRVKPELRPFTILGGPEVTFNYAQIANLIPAEILVRGPGERIIMDLLNGDVHNASFLQQISGISYRMNGTTYHNPDRRPESIPSLLPDVKLIPESSNTYFLYTAHGCPNSCAFCSENAVPYLPRKTEDIRKELSLACRDERPGWILIVDDTFTADVRRCRKLLDILKSEYGGPWSCELTVESIYKNPSLASELVDAGLTRLQIGIESLNDETLRLYRKRATRDQTIMAINSLLQAGVHCVFGNFIVGAPGETKAMIEQNIAAAQELIRKYPGQIELSASILSYNPGAPFFDEPELFGLTISEQAILGSSDLRSAVSSTNTLSKYEIMALHEQFNDAISKEVGEVMAKIPREIIKSHMNFHDLGLSTIWSKKMMATRHISTFYRMVYFDGSHLDIEDIPADTLPDQVPQRTGIQIRLKANGNVILQGFPGELNELNPTASLLYELACGKHTIREITVILQRKIPGAARQPTARIMDDVIAFYSQLANKLQVVFLEQ